MKKLRVKKGELLYLRPEFEERMKQLHHVRHVPDWKYWLHHVLHWHALMAAVMGIVAYSELQYPQVIQIDIQNANSEIFAP